MSEMVEREPEVSEPVQRVARAICRSGLVHYMVKRDGNDGAIRWATDRFGSVDGYVDAHWQDHIEGARVAIEAIREPTDDMISAADSAYLGADVYVVDVAYRAMIDAALK